MKKVAIIQARMDSSRLPGKVLKDIAGIPMLQHMVERVRRSNVLDGLILATTQSPSDDLLQEFCQDHGIHCYRGSQFDVLDRFYQAATLNDAEVVVRITADCPLIDPGLLDTLMIEFDARSVDFAANRLPPPFRRTYPIGLDIEICTFSALQRAWHESDQAFQREHVMPFFYEDIQLEKVTSDLSTGTSRRGFNVLLADCSEDLGDQRWTVDTPQDLEFIRQVFSYFPGRNDFSWLEVLELVREHPDLSLINAGIRHKDLHEVDERNTLE